MNTIHASFPRWKEMVESPNYLGIRFKELLDECIAIIRGDKPDNERPHLLIMQRLYTTWEQHEKVAA